ncbi:MAG TPA: hypothetical protein VF133_02485 [Terriglobales bacterium]
MLFVRVCLLLGLATLATHASAADKPAPSQGVSPEGQATVPSTRVNGGAIELLPDKRDHVPGPPFRAPTAKSQSFVLIPDARHHIPASGQFNETGYNLADVNGNVCYVMRTYKVKRTERIRDDESVFRGYSECEMASTFQLRPAEAHAETAGESK